METGTLVLGVIGADPHNIGIKILEYALTKAGFKVVSLGTLVSQEEFVQAAIETGAAAILVSSVYGHGLLDCIGLKEKCLEAGLGDILLYVGGNLVVGKQEWRPVEETFRRMGFDRVYPPGTSPDRVIADLRHDLSLRNG